MDEVYQIDPTTQKPISPVHSDTAPSWYVAPNVSNPLPVSETHTPRSLIFKRSGLLSGAAGTYDIWTPAAGKKIQLLGWSLSIKPDCTTVAGSEIILEDQGTFLATVVSLNAGGPGISNVFVTHLPMDGFVSAVVNNKVGVNLTNAITTGGIYLTLWGYEI